MADSSSKHREHNQGNQSRTYTPEQKSAVDRVRRCKATDYYAILDSLAVDADGNVCVADIPSGGITVISPEGKRIAQYPMPDEFTTNICFGGADLRTAYVTLSSTGQLVAMPWPRAGLKLNFSEAA